MLQRYNDGVHTSPQTYKELFNYRHARLRNVIERIFGVIKRRFKVLVIAQEYSPEVQSRLICGLAVLHNFIRIYDPADVLEDTELEMAVVADQETARAERMTARLADQAVDNEERTQAAQRRESIALAMWAEYERRPARRNRRVTRLA